MYNFCWTFKVQVQCAAGQVYCCTLPNPTPTPIIGCGALQSVPATTVTPGAGEANFGEFPWQVSLWISNKTNFTDRFQGGGTDEGARI